MFDLWNVSTIKNILKNYGFQFSKSLGQNFIIDKNVCPRMAEGCGGDSNTGVLEIGPGIGVLTVELAKRFKKVVSVEIDKNLIPILKETTSDYGNIKIIENDILKINLKEIVKSEFKDCTSICVCANLPYYITSEIIMYILESNIEINSIIVMVQKEAGDRICAKPGTRNSGAISLAVSYYGAANQVFKVPRSCFLPQPNVDSEVIKIDLDRNNSINVKDKRTYFKVVKAAYGKRRKNILNSLSMGLGMPKSEISEILESLDINSKLRAEQLHFDDFVNISNKIYSKIKPTV